MVLLKMFWFFVGVLKTLQHVLKTNTTKVLLKMLVKILVFQSKLPALEDGIYGKPLNHGIIYIYIFQ